MQSFLTFASLRPCTFALNLWVSAVFSFFIILREGGALIFVFFLRKEIQGVAALRPPEKISLLFFGRPQPFTLLTFASLRLCALALN